MLKSIVPCLVLTVVSGCLPPPEVEPGSEPKGSDPKGSEPVSPFKTRYRSIGLDFGACEGLDPSVRPGDALVILDKVASAQTSAPAQIIFAHWRSESSEVFGDRGQAGGCNALKQYEIRDRWLKGGNGEKQRQALSYIATTTGRNVDDIQGSCGTSTMEKRGNGFGGCIGPAQITPREWVEDEEFRDKDPFNLCHALLYLGKRLKRTHDQALGDGVLKKMKNKDRDYAAWEYASRRYAGSPTKPVSLAYYEKLLKRWRSWDEWERSGVLEHQMFRVAERSGRKWRGGMTLAYNK